MWALGRPRVRVLHVRGAAARRRLVPVGMQNVAESTVDFVHNGIILETIGPDGTASTRRCCSRCSRSSSFCNIWEIMPFAQMPVNARIALPLFFALLVWVIYNIVGIEQAGLLRLLQGRRCSRRACPGRSTFSWRRSSSCTMHHRAAALASRPSLRQHARRPPAADHASPSSRPRSWSLSLQIVICRSRSRC